MSLLSPSDSRVTLKVRAIRMCRGRKGEEKERTESKNQQSSVGTEVVCEKASLP